MGHGVGEVVGGRWVSLGRGKGIGLGVKRRGRKRVVWVFEWPWGSSRIIFFMTSGSLIRVLAFLSISELHSKKFT